MSFDTRTIGAAPDTLAPDGSSVFVLCAGARGSMAMFSLSPGAVSRAIEHRSVEELWYVVGGAGRIWRRCGDQQEITVLAPGVSLSIPPAMQCQFRCDGAAPLCVLGVTMPPWPGADEAVFISGPWPA